ncbi:hypothetical protein N657DRAFT_555427, partial [Parathielavia appendiculata]
MEPFVHIPEYPFVVCKECQFACVTGEVTTHLRMHHGHIQVQERRRIAESIGDIPGIAGGQEELRSFQFPPPTVTPIRFIAPPKPDGIRCDRCGFIVRTIAGIRRHCRKEHGWVSGWTKGGNVVKRAKEERQVPWTTGVRCQRFFRSRVASGWFEVGRGSAEEAASNGEGETLEEQLARIHTAQAGRFKARKRAIKAGDEKAEPNAWLNRVGWAEHLAGLDRDRLRGSVEPIGDDEAGLKRMWESMERVMGRARAAVLKRSGHAVLFEINRKEVHIKPSKPFEGRMEDDTWARSKEVYRKLLCFIRRTQDWDD